MEGEDEDGQENSRGLLSWGVHARGLCPQVPNEGLKTRVSSPAGVPRDPNAIVAPAGDQTSDGHVLVDNAQLSGKASVDEVKAEQRSQGRKQRKPNVGTLDLSMGRRVVSIPSSLFSDAI